MTDIVDRLRELEVTICHEAADAIVHLRDRLWRIDNHLDVAASAIDRATKTAKE